MSKQELSNNVYLGSIYFFILFISLVLGEILSIFRLQWVLNQSFKENVLQLMICPTFKHISKLLWSNAINVVLSGIWFGKKQGVFHDKFLPSKDRFGTARHKALSWCSLSKLYLDLFHSRYFP